MGEWYKSVFTPLYKYMWYMWYARNMYMKKYYDPIKITSVLHKLLLEWTRQRNSSWWSYQLATGTKEESIKRGSF